MVFIIGDVHGEISKLKRLVSNILAIDNKPTFVFIGDYIDKGEDSRATIEYLAGLKTAYTCTFLMGNHEYVWLNIKEKDSDGITYLEKYGGRNTVKSFNCSDIPETRQAMLSAYGNFFDALRPFFIYKNYAVVHSGIKPAQFETLLHDINIEDILFNRYDFIGNSAYYLEQYTIVFGHTGFYTPYYDGFKIGLDTAACFLESQPLTAFNADENYFINSDNTMNSLSSINTLSCPNILRNKPWRTF